MNQYNVGDLISDFLFENDLKTVFGVVSVHNIPILDAIAKRNLIKFIPARGEMGAGHMADGFSRSSDKVGVVITSTGPGAANVVGSLVEARFAGTPLLHITGQTATENLDKNQGTVHDVPNQLDMLKSVSKNAYRISSSKNVLDVLEKALEEAMSPPTGPVSIEVPIDVQRTIINGQETFNKVIINEKNISLGDLNSLDLIEEEIRKSKRKILWIGNGGKKLTSEVEKFIDLGFAVITSTQGRGVIDENHEMCLGSFNAIPKVEKFYSSLDLMIVVGSRLRGHETKDMSLRLPDNLIQIDIDPNAENRTYPSKVFHLGDGKKVLENLYKRLHDIKNTDENWIHEVKSLKEEIKKDYKEFLKIYGEFPEIIERNIPKNARWIRDVTISNSTWGNRLMPVQKWYQNIYPVGAGIGPGMSLGIGASVATGEKVKSIAMCGDGGFMLNVSELWTAVEINSNIIFMVMNDKCYGVIKHIQDSLYGGRRNFADLQVPNFKELADTVKMKYLLIKSSSEFENILKKAFNLSGPVLLEIDINNIGELPRYFIPPPFTEK